MTTAIDETRPAWTLTVGEYRALLRAELAELVGTSAPEPRADGDTYTPAQVAERWRCSRRHVYALVHAGRIRVIRVGDPERGRMLIAASEVERIEREGGGR